MVADIPLVTTLGYTSAIAVGFAILGALTLLPALFGLVGSHVSALTLPFRKSVPTRRSPRSGRGWHGDRESPLAGDDRRAGGAAGALDPHAVLRLGQEDVGAEPTDTTARQAYDLITRASGRGRTGRS